MTRYYFISFFIHALIILAVITLTIKEEKIENLELVQKQMVVSIKNQRANISSSPVNKEIIAEEKTEEKKIEKSIKEEKIIENKVLKKSEKINNKLKSEKKIKPVPKTTKERKTSQNNKQEAYNEFLDSNKFILGKDGIFTAISTKGIEYEIIKEIDPEYPIRAKKMGYKGVATVKFRFLVNTSGKIEDITFISGEKDYGFKEESEKALKKWEFKPIKYKNKPIKVFFEKEFKYEKK